MGHSKEFKWKSKEFGIPPSMFEPTRHSFLTGQGVRIGVIDSGAPTDQFISSRIKQSRSFVSDGGAVDTIGHATKVMGRIVPFAPNAEIYSAKVTNAHSGIEPMTVLRAMDWLVDCGVHVINLSLGFSSKRRLPDGQVYTCTGHCSFCQDMVSYLQAGFLVVTAAGNDGPGPGTITCPGHASDIICVGATDLTGQLLNCSGRGTPQHQKPDLVAPGAIVVSGCTQGEGTSFAAPVVTGLLASALGNYTKEQVVTALRRSCVTIGRAPNEMGAGLISPTQFMEVLRSVHLSSAN